MNAESALKGKRILVVDDEPDVLTTVAEILDMCQVDKASDFETGLQLIMKNKYDAVYRQLELFNRFGNELFNHLARMKNLIIMRYSFLFQCGNFENRIY